MMTKIRKKMVSYSPEDLGLALHLSDSKLILNFLIKLFRKL